MAWPSGYLLEFPCRGVLHLSLLSCLCPGCGLCGSLGVSLGLFGAYAMVVGCYFVIFGCLCPGCGRVFVCLSFARGVSLGFFGRFACWPCMWGLV